MSQALEQKKAVVAAVTGALDGAGAAVLAEYRGLTVAEMTELRSKAREAGVWLRVVKNTLARRAVQDTDFGCLNDHLVGPLAFALSPDPVAVAKLLRDFAKTHDRLKLTVGAMSGQLLSADEIDALAKLPGRQELLSMLAGTLKAPISKLVGTLHAVPSKFVRTLAAVRDQREAAA
ncbi:MAG: 50S ribosomal protein L10 [Gammaproteobacteria bacterium]|jgi:large subunit ribosomal protein L10|nr:50S ribosomal protein L10 [Gammaproteobacteria bacterium]